MSSTIAKFTEKGFISVLPKKANPDDFEMIVVKGKSGKKIKMYRKRKEQIDKEDLENFTKSLQIFQQNLS